jgi:hypothetical protein
MTTLFRIPGWAGWRNNRRPCRAVGGHLGGSVRRRAAGLFTEYGPDAPVETLTGGISSTLEMTELAGVLRGARNRVTDRPGPRGPPAGPD